MSNTSSLTLSDILCPSGLGKPRRYPVEPPARTRAVAQLA